MKTKAITGILLTLFLASMLSMTFIPKAMAHTEGDPFVTDLIAGGGNPKSAITVGDVKVWNDAEYLYVKYVITETDWCLTETHLHIFLDEESFTDIPQKNGNPIPGHFDYSMEHDCVTEYTYEIPLEWPCTDLYVAAHAVVQLEESCPAIMYGTSLGISGVGDKIYEIDVSTLTATELFDTGLSPSSINGPNGNAYDPVNNRLYYSAYTSPDSLYFYDFTNPVNNPSGSLPGGMVACAGWYNGKYYYIPQQTGKLYEVTFNTDGTINTATKICDYSGKSFNFGDVAITPNGLMYGSSAVNGVGKFWSIDLKDCTYTEISTMAHMQLAFGSDGVLYSHDAGNANFYTIDPVLGTRTEIGTIDCLKFTDLASGPYEPCTYRTETAWGAGSDFPGKNWATYFTYGVQPIIIRWPETGTAYIGYEDLPNAAGSDFDYNDFGMSMVITETHSFQGLHDIDIRCVALVKLAGYWHKIHLYWSDDKSGTVDLTEWDSTGTVALRTYSGTFAGSVDLLVFDDTRTDKGHITTIHITFDDPVTTGMAPPYDPYIYVVNTGETYHIGDLYTDPKAMPAGSAYLPWILVVPVTWLPPAEAKSIWTVYGYFDEYYVNGGFDIDGVWHTDWYNY